MKEFELWAFETDTILRKYCVKAETLEEAKQKVFNQEEEPGKEYPGDCTVDKVITQEEYENWVNPKK